MKESTKKLVTEIVKLASIVIGSVGGISGVVGYFKAKDVENVTKRHEVRINVIDSTLHIPINNVSGNDTPFATPQVANDAEISTLLEGRIPPAPPFPDGPDHINTFFQEPSSDGLAANSNKEAWVMAYIEKHQGEYSYKERKIYMFGDRNGKRDAIIWLVKEKGVDALFDKIAPKKVTHQ